MPWIMHKPLLKLNFPWPISHAYNKLGGSVGASTMVAGVHLCMKCQKCQKLLLTNVVHCSDHCKLLKA